MTILILKQSLARVQYVFLSLLLQRMQGRVRRCDQNEVVTLPMASQQLTTMLMVQSRGKSFACGGKEERRVTSSNKCQGVC